MTTLPASTSRSSPDDAQLHSVSLPDPPPPLDVHPIPLPVLPQTHTAPHLHPQRHPSVKNTCREKAKRTSE
ncbi:hypothetical protein R3P38DRAFT_3223163 [Favolaschia claudopus]|uniref:Uncharacterized protein n=1 Tax=Favolaschia claudopus TaxID=2862362 RepID=A0AAV9ZXU8_9AGAR